MLRVVVLVESREWDPYDRVVRNVGKSQLDLGSSDVPVFSVKTVWEGSGELNSSFIYSVGIMITNTLCESSYFVISIYISTVAKDNNT